MLIFQPLSKATKRWQTVDQKMQKTENLKKIQYEK